MNNTMPARISASYTTSKILGNYDVGGLIGDGQDAIVTDSYWDSTVSGLPTSDGNGESRTSEELKMGTGNTYTEWAHSCLNDDETPVWDFGTDKQYPVIQCTPNFLDQRENEMMD